MRDKKFTHTAAMRKLFAAAMLAASLFSVAGCDVSSMSTLADVSKPYVGVYSCKTLTLGERDLLKDFEYLRLELGYKGDCTLSYRTLAGREEELSGRYTADTVCPELTFTYVRGEKSVSKTYRFEHGTLYVQENFGGVLLYGEFRR